MQGISLHYVAPTFHHVATSPKRLVFLSQQKLARSGPAMLWIEAIALRYPMRNPSKST